MLQVFTKSRKLLTVALLLCFGAIINNAMAWVGNGTASNPWQIKDGGGSGVNAYVSGVTLYINGSGDMADFWSSTEGEAPWNPKYYSNSSAITNVVIQSGVTNIGDRAFKDLNNLQTITIPTTVTIIGRQAFYNCTSLQSVTIPNSVSTIEYGAFLNSSIGTLTIAEGTTPLAFIGTSGYPYYYDWFKGCSIQTLSLGRNYSYEGSTSPFNGIALSSLTIKNTVTSLGPLAFGNCSSLNKVTIEDGTSILTFTGGSSGSLYSTTGCFYNSPINTVYLGRNISFSSTYSGYMYAFRGNAGLKSLTVGSSVNSITDYAFEGCKGLTSVTIPNSVTTIGNYAFSSCSTLPSVSIPASVTTIGSNAFALCSGLTSVTISKSATSVAINDGAFNSCSSLSSITIPNTVASLGPLAFGNCNSLNKVTIEDGASILTFTGGSSGSLYSTTGCFYNSPINTVYLGRNISFSSTYSGYMYAFRGNAGLKSLTVGSSVNSIMDYTFEGCKGLTSVTIPSSVTTIGNYAFSGCSALPSVSIPASVTTIGSNAFASCSGLTSVTISKSATSVAINDGAFNSCSSLSSITIPNTVASLGPLAFGNCSSLNKVTIEDGASILTFTGGSSGSLYSTTGCFYNSPINTVYLGRNISFSSTYSGYMYAFRGNAGLKSLTIGSSVNSIIDYTFQGCNGITTITSQNPVPPTAGNYTFDGINKATCTVNVPYGYKCAYKSANQWKDFVNIVDGTTTPCTNGIEDVVAEPLKIYPNPVKDEIVIKSDLPIKKVEIYSLAGTLMKSENNFNGKISVSALPQGVYLLKVYTDNGLVVSKIVKK